ncbi:MAG: hypothetical protein Q7V88_02785 [Actinomycetota bacterium]|nr:hypothetical protein [Actinomycetota bacterium]
MPSTGVNDRAEAAHPSRPSIALALAHWLEQRLHESVGFCHRGCRLYGLEVLDAEGLSDDRDTGGAPAARMVFVAEGADVADALDHPDAKRLLDFDAAAMVTLEWRMVGAAGPPRPRTFPVRRRARVVEVRTPAGGATVLRFEHEPELVVMGIAS